ncbi:MULTISPECIES: ABA4-like family protein [unclassified Roseibium]|uniref:ABA4-like family protein n=1 Tax=unclassified Roseibium TaxID=2629323 RepID=UPI00273FEEEC|nr:MULTISPECIES: ABA4-like family protein [unclassified Roseibium]
MDYETVFSGVSSLAMLGWVLLLISPLIPKWSDRISGYAIPALLAVSYVAIVGFFPVSEGGYGSFSAVAQLFSNPNAVMAGWNHFLAFDLFVGAWMCRSARAKNTSFWMVLPCLPVTFMFGPAGFLMFVALGTLRSAIGAEARVNDAAT